jgi:hypothetical protein
MTTRERSGFAVGTTATAGILLITVGLFHIMQAFVELFTKAFYGAATIGVNWAFRFNVGTWGWLHLLGGIIVLGAGFGLFTGSVISRTVAVIIAVISIVLSFMWLPYYPFWSMIIIAFDVIVIWALTMHGRDITE